MRTSTLSTNSCPCTNIDPESKEIQIIKLTHLHYMQLISESNATSLLPVVRFPSSKEFIKHTAYSQLLSFPRLTNSSFLFVRAFTVAFQYLGTRILSSSIDNSSPASSTSSPKKTSLFLLSFFKFEVVAAVPPPVVGRFVADCTGLILIAVGFDPPIDDAAGMTLPTAEATATSTLGAEGCGISTPSAAGGGGNAKFGGAPGGGIANDGGGRPGGGRPGGSGAAPGGNIGGGGGGGIGAKLTCTGSSVKQSSVSVKSL